MKHGPLTLFCSSCGTGGQTANAYCKRCGKWLPDFKKRSQVAFGGETPQQNVFTGLFISALSAVVALFSAIALYATYLGTPEAKWSVYLTAGFCLCIAAWQASSFLVGLKLRRRLNNARGNLSDTTELETPHSIPALNAADKTNFVTIPSVTENTTSRLETIPVSEKKS